MNGQESPSRLGRDDRRGRFRPARGNLTKLGHGGHVSVLLVLGGRVAVMRFARMDEVTPAGTSGRSAMSWDWRQKKAGTELRSPVPGVFF